MSNLIDLFIAPAYAEATTSAASAAGGNPLSMVFMFAIFFLFFYFVMWRPQSKRAKEHRELMGSLTKGDEVVTSGGMLGKISKLTEQYVALAVDGSAEIVVQKSAIVAALPKGTLKSLE